MSAEPSQLGRQLGAEPPLNPDPRGIEAASWRARLLGRLRGERSLAAMRKRGLRADPPIRVGLRSFIDANYAWAIEIGSQTIISNDVRIVAHDAAIKRLTGYTEVRPVTIGKRCYLGAGTLVLPGATIGDDAIIGAGAVVRGEIPAGSVAVGAPAQAIGTAAELRERHRAELESCPRFDLWPHDLDRSQVDRLQRALAESGRVYLY
jgi:carbonic anhydrase/acetyltransferase-like protein (isoleucine patch superfamily)